MSLAEERATIKESVRDGAGMKQIVLAIVNLAEEVLNLAERMGFDQADEVPPAEAALETPYLAIPPVPSTPAWRQSLRALIENARPAVEAMKDGRTQDYMLNHIAMIAFFDGLEEALRATAADKDWQSLPEYSTSVPTWMMGEDGELIGVKKWKCHWQRPGEDYWMIGEAFSFPLSKRVNILWSRIPA